MRIDIDEDREAFIRAAALFEVHYPGGPTRLITAVEEGLYHRRVVLDESGRTVTGLDGKSPAQVLVPGPVRLVPKAGMMFEAAAFRRRHEKRRGSRG